MQINEERARTDENQRKKRAKNNEEIRENQRKKNQNQRKKILQINENIERIKIIEGKNETANNYV